MASPVGGLTGLSRPVFDLPGKPSLLAEELRNARLYPKRLQIQWVLFLLAGASVVALLFAGHLYFGCQQVRRPITWATAMRATLTAWYVWALFSPFIFWLTRRFSFERTQRIKCLAIHIAAGLTLSFAKLKIEAILASLAGPPGINESVVLAYQFNFLTYWTIAGAGLAFHYYRMYQRYQESALRSSQLEAKLAQAELQVLKMQLQPHFLFNTLHAISALIYSSPEAADNMIARLSELLRFALESFNLMAVPLRREIELLRTYLEIEHIRFGDRLKVVMDVDERTLDTMVPSLILQPLVENAVRHGVSRRSSGGRIDVRIKSAPEAVDIEIQDDGPGAPRSPQKEAREGVGLSNARARLDNLYGNRYNFSFGNVREGGFLVKLTIPAYSTAISSSC